MTKKARTSRNPRSEAVGMVTPLTSVIVLPRSSSGVEGSSTITPPSMKGCSLQTNTCRPGLVGRHPGGGGGKQQAGRSVHGLALGPPDDEADPVSWSGDHQRPRAGDLDTGVKPVARI